MARITIKTLAYSRNPHFLEIAAALREAGIHHTPNVAIDGQVSLDFDAPREVVDQLVAGRPTSVWVETYANRR